MDYKLFLSGFLTAFVTERSKIGPLPLIVLNWAAVVVPGFLAYQALGADDFVPKAGITLAVLILVVGYSTVLSVLRVKKRKRFYKTIKHSLGLQSYTDYNKDSSRFVKMHWNLLNAKRMSFNITVSNLSMRTVKNVINDLNSMFPQSSGEWIIDLDSMKQGAFFARAVPGDSFEAHKFHSTIVLSDIARDQLGSNVFPVKLDLRNERIGPDGYTFDEVQVEKTGTRAVGRLDEEKLLTILNRTYPCEDKEQTWVLDQTDGSIFRIYQENRAKFKARNHVLSVVSEVMSGYTLNHPVVTFEGERTERGQFVFDSVVVEGLKAQSFSDFKAQRLRASLNTAFPLPPSHQWNASLMSDILTISREEVPEQVAAEEEEELIAPEPEETGWEYHEEPVLERSEPVAKPRAAVAPPRPSAPTKRLPQPPAIPRPARPAGLPQMPARPVLRSKD